MRGMFFLDGQAMKGAYLVGQIDVPLNHHGFEKKEVIDSQYGLNNKAAQEQGGGGTSEQEERTWAVKQSFTHLFRLSFCSATTS